jgi:hypothetical protein
MSLKIFIFAINPLKDSSDVKSYGKIIFELTQPINKIHLMPESILFHVQSPKLFLCDLSDPDFS